MVTVYVNLGIDGLKQSIAESIPTTIFTTAKVLKTVRPENLVKMQKIEKKKLMKLETSSGGT